MARSMPRTASTASKRLTTLLSVTSAISRRTPLMAVLSRAGFGPGTLGCGLNS
jgi:hypothetical protein